MENFNKNNNEFIPESGFNNALKEHFQQKEKTGNKQSFDIAVNDHLKRMEEILKNIKGLPTEQEIFTVSELKEIIEVRKQIDTMIDEFYSKYSDSDITNKRECLYKIMEYLDTLKIWSQKFSTGEKDDHDEENYSIYYVTDKNISLRIKKINLEKYKLNRIIQPFMEYIYFKKDKYYPSEKAMIDSSVREYCSKNFRNLQSQNPNTLKTDFTSEIKKFYKDNALYYILGPEQENLYHYHEGHEVNKIYF